MTDYAIVFTGVFVGFVLASWLAWRFFCWRVHRRYPDADLRPLAEAFWMPWKR